MSIVIVRIALSSLFEKRWEAKKDVRGFEVIQAAAAEPADQFSEFAEADPAADLSEVGMGHF